MTEELKPCPFCGSPARLNRSKGESLWSHDQVEWTQVQCTNEDCGVATENRCEGWEPEPVESWNTRALTQRPAAQTEREAFENAALAKWGPLDFERSPHVPDMYYNQRLDDAWIGFGFAVTWLRASLPAPQQATPEPLPEHADHVTEIASRLRLVAKLIGCPEAVPSTDKTAVGAIYSVLGNMRHALELTQATPEPIPMVLHCPKCGMQHVDAPDPMQETEGWAGAWANPPHRSHLCHGCGTIWRPADVPTTGVKAITTKGKADTWEPGQATPEPVARSRECTEPMCACMGGPCAECPEGEREKEIADLRTSRDFYKRRADAMQQAQSHMRDPERTMVCDILANGALLVPAGDRYAVTPEPVGEPVAWRWMPSHVFPTWVYSDDQNRVADARRFMGDGGVQALYTRPAPGVPEDVLAILDECRSALMECDRDGDYALIDRIDALAAAQAKGGR